MFGMSDKMVKIGGLEPNTVYRVRAIIVEKEGNSVENGAESSFRTKKCTPLGI